MRTVCSPSKLLVAGTTVEVVLEAGQILDEGVDQIQLDGAWATIV